MWKEAVVTYHKVPSGMNLSKLKENNGEPFWTPGNVAAVRTGHLGSTIM
jgi:hypothetical protein